MTITHVRKYKEIAQSFNPGVYEAELELQCDNCGALISINTSVL